MNEEQAAARWARHPFFGDDTVVLGLDIGIEGIGITVRKGREWLYSRTLLVDLPEAKALAGRRQMRGGRHARKNRRTRQNRLKKLFARHGLPWVSDEVYSRSDPFKLRLRAIEGRLASPEALSLCIRSCVMLRGYDYFAMTLDKGEFPWGGDNKLSDALKWLPSQFLDRETAQYLRDLRTDLRGRREELSEEEVQRWDEAIANRERVTEKAGIEKVLREYKGRGVNAHRARGYNFPRSHVEKHLRTILERHKDMIDHYDDFVSTLFLPCDSRRNRRKAIFHYNRKTPGEAATHYRSKVKECPFGALGIVPSAKGAKCGQRGSQVIRRWNIVNFLSNHRFDLKCGKLTIDRRLLPAAGIRALVEYVMHESRPSWQAAKKAMEDAMQPLKLATKNDWNDSQVAHLKDIVAPPVKVRRGRAKISEAAAEELYRQATADGQNFEPTAIEAWKKESGYYEQIKRIDDTGLGLYPQVQTLLGTLRKRTARDKDADIFATTGLLQRIFEKEIADKLGGKKVPDYCVIECIKDPARNQDQKNEIAKKQAENRKRREKLIEEAGLSGQEGGISHAQALRLRLFAEQGGSKTKDATCPFTGENLGKDALDANLELAHLFPDSKGGLYIAENLVLTTRATNEAMKDRTPKEAAAAGLPGWLSWSEMLKRSQKFTWGRMKRYLFAFPDENAEGGAISFPDFNNMTRTAQLARELRRLVAAWMGIELNPEAMRQRIGNISGVYTAAARKSIFGDDFVKDRADNNHHRMDAAVMTCIPPAEGVNDVQYGGVFTTRKRSEKDGYSAFRMIDPQSLPLPDFRKLSELDKDAPPVIKQRSRSKSKSLGDSTFWRVEVDGSTSQRTPIDTSKMTASVIYSGIARAINYAKQGRENLSEQLIPSESTIEKWLTAAQPATRDDKPSVKPLRLTNGTPIRSIRKYDSKGSFSSPIGWSAVVQEGRIFQARSLDGSNDRMEIWLGWNAKKKQWQYYRRLIPTKAAMDGLKRMGLPWRGRKGAPEFLLKLLEEKKVKDLRSLVCGELPPSAVKVGAIRKGDMFKCVFRVDDKAVEKIREKIPHFSAEDFPAQVACWGAVSAILSVGKIEISCIERKDRKKTTCANVDELARIIGLPAAVEKAQLLNLRHPA